MRMVRFACSGCGRELRVLSGRAGSPVRCPRCGATTRAPESGDERRRPAAASSPPRPSREAGGRRPCPFCAESIPAEAKKCRFCGEFLDAAPKRRRFNPFSTFSVLVAFGGSFAALGAMVLLQSMVGGMTAGAAVAGLGALSGLAGVGLAVAGRRRGAIGGGVGFVFNGVTLGLFLYAVGTLNTLAASAAVPEFLRKAINPGRNGGRKVVMMCAACGERAEVPAWDVLRHYLHGMEGVMRALRDPGSLDRLERSGSTGLTCPACGRPKLFPTLVCEHCGERFLNPWRTGEIPLDLKVRCPRCGKVQQRLGPYGLDTRALERLSQDLDAGRLKDLLKELKNVDPGR